MKITGIELHILLVPEYDALACSSAQDDLIVAVHTDEGIVGVGETGPYRHHGLQQSDGAVVAMVAECRRAVGPDLVLMVDVAYAWPDAGTALGVLQRLAPYDLYFLETPTDIDDLDGYAFLHAR